MEIRLCFWGGGSEKKEDEVVHPETETSLTEFSGFLETNSDFPPPDLRSVHLSALPGCFCVSCMNRWLLQASAKLYTKSVTCVGEVVSNKSEKISDVVFSC